MESQNGGCFRGDHPVGVASVRRDRKRFMQFAVPYFLAAVLIFGRVQNLSFLSETRTSRRSGNTSVVDRVHRYVIHLFSILPVPLGRQNHAPTFALATGWLHTRIHVLPAFSPKMPCLPSSLSRSATSPGTQVAPTSHDDIKVSRI